MDPIKVLDEEKAASIIEEGEINYKTGRFEDAAKNFEYLSREMLDTKHFEDMLYFSYRALIARKQINDMRTMVKNLQTLGLDILKISTYLASDYLNKTPIYEDKTELLWIAQNNLKLLGDHKRKKYYSLVLTKIYSQFAEDVEFPFEERISFLERNLLMFEEIEDYSGYNLTKESIGKLYENQAAIIKKSQGFDNELVAARMLTKSASNFHDIGDIEKYDQLVEQAKNLDPTINVDHEIKKSKN